MVTSGADHRWSIAVLAFRPNLKPKVKLFEGRYLPQLWWNRFVSDYKREPKSKTAGITLEKVIQDAMVCAQSRCLIDQLGKACISVRKLIKGPFCRISDAVGASPLIILWRLFGAEPDGAARCIGLVLSN